MTKHTVIVEMRRRARPDDDPLELHDRFLTMMREAGSPWWDPRAAIKAPAIAGSFEGQTDISKGLRGDAVGHLGYVRRDPAYLQDKARFDDRLVASFRADDHEYADLVNTGFRPLLVAFEPYRAQLILDEDLAQDDWDIAVARCGETGKDADGRDGMIRLWPVVFMDDELCQRSLGMSPDAVAVRLEGNVERIELFLNGVLIIATTKLLDRDEVVESDRRIRALLAEASA